jgi:hypothetical protein
MPLSSSDTAALGYNVFSAILDEVNFLAMVEDSTRARPQDEGEYDQAEKLYASVVRRLKSRFQFVGKAPGKIFLISSANYPDDFIDRKCKESEEIGKAGKPSHIFVAKMAQWEAFPPESFSPERFLVEVGDETKKSRILEFIEDAIDPQDVIYIPMDYLDDFKRDLEGAIRDLAGVPVGGSSAFIKSREKIIEAIDSHKVRFEGNQLFNVDRADLTRYNPNFQHLINLDYLDSIPDPTVMFTAHADLSLTGDSCGLAVSHYDGSVEVGKTLNWDEGMGKWV